MAGCLYVGVTSFDDQAKNLDYFKAAILICCLSALISNMSEVFYVEMLLDMNFTLRAKAEGVGILMKGIAIYSLIKMQYGLLAYSIGEFMLNSTVFIIYYLNKSMSKESINSAMIYNKFFKVNPLSVVSNGTGKGVTGYL